VCARALAFVIVAVAAAAEEGAPGSVRKEGDRYALICHGGDEALAGRALAVVEEAWPIVAETFGVPDAKPERLLEVHFYRTVEGYQAADDALTGGKFRRNLAMSHWDTRTAHVALQPPCRDETVRALGLPPLTVVLLAWEAAHVARYELCANFRDHPQWFGDGLAASVAAKVVTSRHPSPLGAVPYWANDMARVQRLLAEGKLPPARSILSDEVDDLDLRDRYATRFVFFSFLAGEPNRARLAEVAGAIRRTGGGAGYAESVRKVATDAFGRSDEAFAAFVGELHPQWDEVFRSLWPVGDDRVQVAFPDTNAIAWRTEPVASAAFKAQGSLRILPGDARQMNFLFARTEEGFYSLAFVADQGFVLFDHRSKTGEWNRVGEGNAPGLRLGVTTDFAVEGRGAKLKVTLDGKSWDFDLPRELPDSIVWGLGAQAGPKDAATGSAGLWKGVSIDALDR
jgi:hypothetical protein